ncbi:MAG TPA: divalent-cation tolerance protein CutA [Pseudonocardiaceae bacterium]
MADCVQVLTTVDSEEAAERLARGMVDGRLAACVQVVGPICSVYRWQGVVQAEQEWQCLAKTTAERLDELVEHLGRHHPYDLPEIIATPIVGGSQDYLRWVSEQV